MSTILLQMISTIVKSVKEKIFASTPKVQPIPWWEKIVPLSLIPSISNPLLLVLPLLALMMPFIRKPLRNLLESLKSSQSALKLPTRSQLANFLNKPQLAQLRDPNRWVQLLDFTPQLNKIISFLSSSQQSDDKVTSSSSNSSSSSSAPKYGRYEKLLNPSPGPKLHVPKNSGAPFYQTPIREIYNPKEAVDEHKEISEDYSKFPSSWFNNYLSIGRCVRRYGYVRSRVARESTLALDSPNFADNPFLIHQGQESHIAPPHNYQNYTPRFGRMAHRLTCH
ncbi:MAG: hypothetical protein MHMPM18_003048 [Marteilia pararefringens]